jgi:hypothetical protein
MVTALDKTTTEELEEELYSLLYLVLVLSVKVDKYIECCDVTEEEQQEINSSITAYDLTAKANEFSWTKQFDEDFIRRLVSYLEDRFGGRQ